MSCFSLAREMNLATCSTWHWISQRASDSSCRPLAAARKSSFALLLTEAQHLWEMFKGAPACNRALPRAQFMSNTQEGWAEPAQGYLPVGGVCKLIGESPHLGWHFYLSAVLALQPPEPSISCGREKIAAGIPFVLCKEVTYIFC